MYLWCFGKGLDEQDSMEFIWKEKSVEDMVTLGPTAQATHYCLLYILYKW
jgi:hypothetical protein